ncbi:uncharacterized protein LOC144339476, partial [Macaca mulatta]
SRRRAAVREIPPPRPPCPASRRVHWLPGTPIRSAAVDGRFPCGARLSRERGRRKRWRWQWLPCDGLPCTRVFVFKSQETVSSSACWREEPEPRQEHHAPQLERRKTFKVSGFQTSCTQKNHLGRLLEYRFLRELGHPASEQESSSGQRLKRELNMGDVEKGKIFIMKCSQCYTI